MYFHLIANGVIVYYSLTVSVSFFFALHISLIVFFYCYNSYGIDDLSSSNGQEYHKYDI